MNVARFNRTPASKLTPFHRIDSPASITFQGRKSYRPATVEGDIQSPGQAIDTLRPLVEKALKPGLVYRVIQKLGATPGDTQKAPFLPRVLDAIFKPQKITLYEALQQVVGGLFTRQKQVDKLASKLGYRAELSHPQMEATKLGILLSDNLPHSVGSWKPRGEETARITRVEDLTLSGLFQLAKDLIQNKKHFFGHYFDAISEESVEAFNKTYGAEIEIPGVYGSIQFGDEPRQYSGTYYSYNEPDKP